MPIDVKIINPLECDKWDRLLTETYGYSIFHSYAWIKVLWESFKYKPFFVILKNQKKLSAIFPLMEVNSPLTGHRCVSLPFSDYCDPIITDAVYTQKLLECTIEFCKKSKCRFLDIHGGEILFKGKNPSTIFYNHHLELNATPDIIFQKIRPSTRRNIKKAHKLGVSIHQSNSLQSMRDFYRLHCITRKRHKLPVQPFQFFQKIHEHIISKKLGMIIKARYHEKIVGASVFFHFGKKAIFKYGASDLNYQKLRMNNLIMWETIKWYFNNGYESFNFGRTNFDNNGLRQFKRGWGGKENFLKYYKYNLNTDSFIINNFDNFDSIIHFAFGKLPIPISQILGTLLYKHFG